MKYRKLGFSRVKLVASSIFYYAESCCCFSKYHKQVKSVACPTSALYLSQVNKGKNHCDLNDMTNYWQANSRNNPQN